MVAAKDFPKKHILGARQREEEVKRRAMTGLQVGCPTARLGARLAGAPGLAWASLFPALSTGSMVSGHD